jgi:hypothetical protein
MPGGYVLRDLTGKRWRISTRDNKAEARQAKPLTKDEAPRVTINIARLAELLGKASSDLDIAFCIYLDPY